MNPIEMNIEDKTIDVSFEVVNPLVPSDMKKEYSELEKRVSGHDQSIDELEAKAERLDSDKLGKDTFDIYAERTGAETKRLEEAVEKHEEDIKLHAAAINNHAQNIDKNTADILGLYRTSVDQGEAIERNTDAVAGVSAELSGKASTESVNDIKKDLGEFKTATNNALSEKATSANVERFKAETLNSFDSVNGSVSALSAEQEAVKGEVEQIGADVQTAQQTADNAVTIAKGRATGYVFDTVESMQAWIPSHKAELVLGDNLYIRATNVPDYWWDGQTAQMLETQKVDLSEYVKNTDYATTTKAGVIKAGYRTAVDMNGVMYATELTKAQYDSSVKNAFISKATLENIKESYVKDVTEPLYQPKFTTLTASAYEALTDKRGWYAVTGD